MRRATADARAQEFANDANEAHVVYQTGNGQYLVARAAWYERNNPHNTTIVATFAPTQTPNGRTAP